MLKIIVRCSQSLSSCWGRSEWVGEDIVTCSQVHKGFWRFWTDGDAHGFPDAVEAADVTGSHLTSQLGQIPRHLLGCEDKRNSIVHIRLEVNELHL